MKSIFRLKMGLPAGLAAIALVSSVLIVAPRKIEQTKAEDCTSQSPTHAQLNVFPVTWTSTTNFSCADFAAIGVRNAADNNYAPQAAAWPGEELYVRIYVHDGAQRGLDE